MTSRDGLRRWSRIRLRKSWSMRQFHTPRSLRNSQRESKVHAGGCRSLSPRSGSMAATRQDRRGEHALRRLTTTVLLAATAMGTQLPVGAQQRPPQSMCVECDSLREQLRIVGEKIQVFDEGTGLLRRTLGDMDRNANAAAGLASAYAILQGLNVAVGLATLPCAIPQPWLRGLLGGAAGLGAYVQDGDAGQVTLAAVVSSLGLGVMSDAISTYEFMQRYREEAEGLDALRRDVEETIRQFGAVHDGLRREGRTLESTLGRGGCSFDPLDALLRR